MTTGAGRRDGTVEAVRSFNRFYTRRIGVLDDGLLDSAYSLAEVRVLYELAQRSETTATALIRDLGLDAGYLSRLLARLVRMRLVARRRSERDGRQQHLTLSARGRTVFAELNRRSSAQIEQMVGHLPDAERSRLAGMMGTVRRLLAEPGEPAGEVSLREPASGDLGWVVQRHGALYAAEYGWSDAFEGLVARIVGDYVVKRDPRRDRCWIAELDGQPVGCVFLVRKTKTVAKLRLLLVEPSARGHGVGRKLVEACVAFAREAGYRKIELWTNSVLTAARRIYERAGFKLVASTPHRSFGHDLVGETWALTLD